MFHPRRPTGLIGLQKVAQTTDIERLTRTLASWRRRPPLDTAVIAGWLTPIN
jgi:hypothetical protein